jgi:hypothetical protein
MLRSRHNNVSNIDRLTILWVLCTIDWCHQNNEKISITNLDRLFGPEARTVFNFYREVAIETEYLAPDGLTLTTKGMRVMLHWRKIQDAILEV